MAMFLSLDEFQTYSGLKSGGASLHPDKGVCHFSLHILAMTSNSDALLGHIADYLQSISNAQSFWFTLKTSMTMAATLPVDSVWTRKTMRLCRLLSRHPGVVLLCQLVVALPLVVLSLRRPLVVLSRQLVFASPLAVLSLCCPLVVLSCQLVVTLPLAVLLLRHPLVNLSRQLVVASPLLVLSLCPAPPSCPLVTPAGCCVASRHATLSSSRRLFVSSCRLSLSRRASWLLRHHLLSSSCCTALSSSHRASWLLCCLSLHRPLIFLS
jgi:hypothetical protein